MKQRGPVIWNRCREDIIYLTLLTIAVLAFFSPVWLGSKVFHSDGQLNAFFSSITFWSDGWIGGWPMAADTAAFSLYPVRWVILHLKLGFNAFVVSAYLIALFGVFFYLRIRGIRPLPSAFGASCFAFSGFMSAHLVHTSMIHATAWIPVALAGVEAILQGGRFRWQVVAWGAVALSFLAGHVQLAFYGVALTTVYLVCRLPSSLRAGRAKQWLLAVGSIGVGVLLAAPQLMLTASYVSETARAAMSYPEFVSFSVPLNQLGMLLAPYMFGGDSRYGGPAYFGEWSLVETCFYVPVMYLAVVALGVKWFDKDGSLFWLIVAVSSLALMLGNQIEPIARIMFAIPGFNAFRVPARHAMEFNMAISVLAATGLNRLLTQRRDAPSTLKLVYGSIAVTGVFALTLFLSQKLALVRLAALGMAPSPGWFRLEFTYAIVGIASIGLLLAAIVATRKLWPPVETHSVSKNCSSGQLVVRTKAEIEVAFVPFSGGLRIFFLAVALGTSFMYSGAGEWFSVSKPTSFYYPTALEQFVAQQVQAGGGRVLSTAGVYGWPLTAERARLLGIPSANWYGPLQPMRAARLLSMTTAGAVAHDVVAENSSALDLYGIKYLILERDPTGISWGQEYDEMAQVLAASPRWRSVFQEGAATVYENSRSLPMAWMVGAWERGDGERTLEILQGKRGPFRPEEKAFVAEFDTESLENFDGRVVQSKWAKDGSFEAEVSSNSGGMVLFGINGLRGWSAWVDGHQIPVSRADYSLLGAKVPPGDFRVTLRYEPPGLIAGAILFMLGIFAAFVLGMFDRCRLIGAGHVRKQ